MAGRRAAGPGRRGADLRDHHRRRHGADGFTQYADTRSQVYEGVAGETAATDAAVAATRGEVVTYGGRPVATYFFSTSGGQTENVENSFLGAGREPWLKSVDDPYDSASPKHRWGPLRFSRARPTGSSRAWSRAPSARST